jgi:hypothetical protein
MKKRFPECRAYKHYQQRYMHFGWSHVRYMFLFFCSLILLGACTSPISFVTPSKSGTVGDAPTPIVTATSAVSPTPAFTPPTITLQVVGSCPSLNWDSLVGTHPHVNKVQKVTCGSLEGNGTLQALVNVRYYTPDAKLDVYAYNLYGTPAQIFKLQGLADGDAQISPAGTIITAEIANNGLPSSTPNVFKEFQWSGGSFNQIMFPGIYPDTTYYQALQDQAAVTAGHNTWKTSGFPVLNNLALRLCHWSQTSDKTVTYDSRTGTYIVQVTNLGPGGGGFVATLFRLNNVTTNIFEVMRVTPLDGVTTLTAPTAGTSLTNPLHVSGTAQGTGNILGHVVLFDETHINIGDTGPIHSSTSSGLVNFTSDLKYQAEAHGMQDGILAFFATTQNNLDLSNQVMMIKVLVSS